MAIFKINKNKNYTIMSNYHLQDKRLTLKSKGLLSIMLSLPDDWDYSVLGLTAICKESKTSIQGILKELEEYGYLIRYRVQNKKGLFEYIYNIYEYPQTDKPCTDKPCTENVPQLNTNKLNTNNIYSDFDRVCDNVINRLNQLTGSKFKSTNNNTRKLIKGRLDEGYTESDLHMVVDKMCYLWSSPKHGEKDMREYLQPSTLFRPTNFENYYNKPVNKQVTLNDIKIDVSDFLKEE